MWKFSNPGLFLFLYQIILKCAKCFTKNTVIKSKFRQIRKEIMYNVNCMFLFWHFLYWQQNIHAHKSVYASKPSLRKYFCDVYGQSTSPCTKQILSKWWRQYTYIFSKYKKKIIQDLETGDFAFCCPWWTFFSCCEVCTNKVYISWQCIPILCLYWKIIHARNG